MKMGNKKRQVSKQFTQKLVKKPIAPSSSRDTQRYTRNRMAPPNLANQPITPHSSRDTQRYTIRNRMAPLADQPITPHSSRHAQRYTIRNRKVPPNLLANQPKRSKRLIEKNNSKIKIFNTATDYFIQSQTNSIFKDIDNNYERAILNLNKNSPNKFCHVLQRQVPQYDSMKLKVLNTIKSLVNQIDTLLEGNVVTQIQDNYELLPEKKWVFQTPPLHAKSFYTEAPNDNFINFDFGSASNIKFSSNSTKFNFFAQPQNLNLGKAVHFNVIDNLSAEHNFKL